MRLIKNSRAVNFGGPKKGNKMRTEFIVDGTKYSAYFGAGGTKIMYGPDGHRVGIDQTIEGADSYTRLMDAAVASLGYQKHVEYDDAVLKLEPVGKRMNERESKGYFNFEGKTYYASACGYNGRAEHQGAICNDPWVTPIPRASCMLGDRVEAKKQADWLLALPKVEAGQKVWVQHYGFFTIDKTKHGRCVFVRDRDDERFVF